MNRSSHRLVLSLALVFAIVAPGAIASHDNGQDNYVLEYLTYQHKTPPPLLVGETVALRAYGSAFGNLTAANATVAFVVDGVEIARVTASQDPFYPQGFVAAANWTADSAGPHLVFAIVDPDNTTAEWSETDNMRITSIFVYSGVPDVVVEQVTARKVPLTTDMGPAPFNPVQRHEVDVTVCNEGTLAVEWGWLDVIVRGVSTTRTLLTGADHVGYADLDGLEPGACRNASFVWDGAGSVGDIEFVATASSSLERERDNNMGSARSFAYVGGMSGIVLPTP